MASVNTTSIREEITHVKPQLDEQVRSGKVADETCMLIVSLLMIVDMLVAIFLEKSTKKGNKNSIIRPRRQMKTIAQNHVSRKAGKTSIKNPLPTVVPRSA